MLHWPPGVLVRVTQLTPEEIVYDENYAVRGACILGSIWSSSTLRKSIDTHYPLIRKDSLNLAMSLIRQIVLVGT